jgi:hypothetical protein
MKSPGDRPSTGIGGRDIVLEGATAPEDGAAIIETFRRRWPALVFQDADQPSPVEWQTTGLETREFFVYRDLAAFSSWREHGAATENNDAMIHVVIEDDRITFVVADGDSETAALAVGFRREK